MATFTGSYTYQIDPRGRMRLPGNFKAMLGEDLHIGYGVGQFLVIYTAAAVEELSEKSSAVDPEDIGKIKMYRNIFGSMKEFTCDMQGRYKIPSDYCEQFGLKDEIVIVGNNKTVEIWSRANYDKRDDDEVSFTMYIAEQRRKAERAAREQLMMQKMLNDKSDN